MKSNNITSNVMVSDTRIQISEDIKEILIIFSFDSIKQEANNIDTEVYQIPNLLDNLEFPLPTLGTEIMDNSKVVLDAMTDAAKVLSKKPPVFKETDCDKDTQKICDEQSLKIDSITIPNFQNNNWTTPGKIEKVSSGTDFNNFAYFPENSSSNEEGMVLLEEDEERYCLTIPLSNIGTTTSYVDKKVDYIPNVKNTLDYTYGENNKFIVTNTNVDYYINDDSEYIERTTITENYYYYNPNYEINFTITNLETDVNSVFVGLLNINVFKDINEQGRKDYQNLSNHAYIFDLKDFDVDISNYSIDSEIKIIIPESRIFLLSQKELIKSKVLKNVKATISQLDVSNDAEPNACLLDDTSEEQYNKVNTNTTKIQEELKKVNNKISDSLKIFDQQKIIDNPINEENNNVIIERNNCPVLYLNDEYNIGLYLIDKKLQLQLPPTLLNRSVKKQIIDYELKENKIYMLKFKSLPGSYEIQLITPDKQTFTLRGSNFNNIELFPTKIASTNTSSFCGFTLYDIILGNGRLKDNEIKDIYISSVLGYKPRLAQMYFDFSKVKHGKLINNLLNTDDVESMYNDQQANVYGKIKTNGYVNCLYGMVDNFFCRDVFSETSFSVCFWINGEINKNKNECVLISDDIGANFIKYLQIDNQTSKIILDFDGKTQEILMNTILENNWSLICLKYELYSNIYELSIQSIKSNIIYKKEIKTKNSFRLMSLLSRYDYRQRMYVDNYYGYMTLISIYFTRISDLYFDELFKEQSIFVEGLMKQKLIINGDQTTVETTTGEEHLDATTESVQLVSDDQLAINNQSNIDYLKQIAGFSDNMDKHDLEKLLKGR